MTKELLEPTEAPDMTTSSGSALPSTQMEALVEPSVSVIVPAAGGA